MKKKILSAVLALMAVTLPLNSVARPVFAPMQVVDETSLAGAKALEDKGDFAGALAEYQKLEAEAVAGVPVEPKDLAQLYHNIGRVYSNMDDITHGRAYTQKALDLWKQLYGEVNERYITSLNNYALTFGLEKNFAEALRLQKQALSLCDQLGHRHPNLGMYLINGGRYAYITQDFKLAAEWWEQALPLVEKYGAEYEFLLTYLADIYMTQGDTDNLNRLMQLTADHNEHQLTLPCAEPICMSERAEYYSLRGDNANAKECYDRAMAMEMTEEQKVKVYSSYARFQEGLRDFSSAAEYYRLAASAEKAAHGESATYAEVLYYAAVFSYLGKKFDPAIDLYKKTIAYYEVNDGPKSGEEIARCNQGIGNVLRAEQKSKEAIPYHQKTVEYYRTNQPESKEYPKAMVYLANAERFAEEYEAAIEHYQEAMALYESREMADKYEETQHALLRCCAAAGKPVPEMAQSEAAARMRLAKIEKIIKEETENLEITALYAGDYAKASSLGVIAGCYAYKEDYGRSVKYFEQYINTLRDALRAQFRIQNEEERMYSWEQQETDMAELFELVAGLEEADSRLLAEYAPTVYNAALLSKGILLNSSIEFEKLLSSTYKDRPELKALYDKTKRADEELNTLRETAATWADLERIATLSRENEQLQLELSRSCSEIADYTQYMGYTWQDVQKALTRKDVAVEFVQIGDKVLGDYRIYAVVLTRELKSPVIVQLDSIQEITDCTEPKTLYSTPELGRRIWGPLARYFEGKENIYFSPAGDFNNIAIEYLLYEGAPMSEGKKVYRLSSTKTLCYQPAEKTRSHHAVLIGGVDYEESRGLVAPSSTTPKVVSYLQSENRGATGFGPLKNTLVEVQQIEQTLKENPAAQVQLYQGAEASEGAFKALSGSDLEILHIATHGAYRAPEHESDEKKSEDLAMQNSYLALAGINQELPDAENDGVVTAADISRMDFRQCQLAVLSACETGLGHLGSDGIFGLQRGFKNAGVGAILMSLWKVDDRATAELMIHFYRALYSASGTTPNDALRSAQKYLRTHGYDAPDLWAAFIVLDGNK